MSVFDLPSLGPGFEQETLIIKCVPLDLSRVHEEDKLTVARIVSVKHRKINCDGCGHQCWIGPEQLKMARDPRVKILCYYCMADDLNIGMAHAGGDGHNVMLNPRANEVPRHSSAWVVTGE